MSTRPKVLPLVLLLLGWVLIAPLAGQEPAYNPRARCLGSNPNAPILIEIFSDYECPACRRYYLETMRQVLADYATAGKVCVVYYEFPLPTHKHSREASRYALAATRLGPEKWIRVTDALYYYQSLWSSTGQLESVVADALSKKDMEKVRGWVDDGKLEASIERDLARGRRRGVRSTPTSFITANGKTERVNGVVQYPILRRFLDRLLEQR